MNGKNWPRPVQHGFDRRDGALSPWAVIGAPACTAD